METPIERRARLQTELTGLFSDAKDVLEAEKFISGTGTNEPEGLLVGGTATVSTAGTASLAVDDVYSLQEAVPPRFQPRPQWVSSNAIGNSIYRLVGTGDTDEPPLMAGDRSSILGKRWSEVSTMATDTTSGGAIVTYGDLRAGYRIIDRIGLSVELVPHLFGSNQRPTGQRGLYAYRHHGPVALVLTRQDVPVFDRARYASAEGLRRGGYVLADARTASPS